MRDSSREGAGWWAEPPHEGLSINWVIQGPWRRLNPGRTPYRTERLERAALRLVDRGIKQHGGAMSQVDEQMTDSGDGRTGTTGGESSRVVFNPEQQAKVQDLIDEAYRKAYSKAMKARSGNDEVERLKGEVTRLKGDKMMAELYRSISRHNVVDAEEVAKLLNDRVRMDEDGNLRVVNSSGNIRINPAGQPVSLDEYLDEWLASRPHHLRSSGGPGAGSHGARFGWKGTLNFNLSDPGSWRSMPRENLEKLLNEGVNVYGSAGQVYRFKDVRNPFLEARKRKFRAMETRER